MLALSKTPGARPSATHSGHGAELAQDPSRVYIVAEAEPVEDEEDHHAKGGPPRPMARWVPSPEAMVGTAVELKQRVMQVALGAEHGILLTDAGIACTWGDNRYGQLGRSRRAKDEEGRPYPVLELAMEEITQVASGRHHCLALTASGGSAASGSESGGLVWSWGRNKSGQCGTLDTRDKVMPERVKRVKGEDQNVQLGMTSRIISIGAGGNSSIAAAANGDVWQWGDISKGFKEGKDKGKDRKQKGKPDTAERFLDKTKPFKVFEKASFRTQLRSAKSVSITETGCRVIPKGPAEDRGRIQDLVDSVRQLQGAIAKERAELAQMDFKMQSKSEAKSKSRGNEGDDQRNLQDTIAMFEREIAAVDREIDDLEKNEKSCNFSQQHQREQLDALMKQGLKWNEKLDELAVKAAEANKRDDKKDLDKQHGEIKEFLEANQNTRMTLLDQRAATDKEKQRIVHDLTRAREKKAAITLRVQSLKKKGEAALNSAGSANTLTQFLREQKRRICERFESDQNDQPKKAFVAAKKQFEKQEEFLVDVEEKIRAVVAQAPDQKYAARIQVMLQDIVDLRRATNDLMEDKWMKNDLDLNRFFESAKTGWNLLGSNASQSDPSARGPTS